MGYILKNTEKWLYNDGSDNGIIIKSDGSLRKIGTAIVYDDLIGDIFARRLYSTTGTLDYDYNEQMIKFQAGGDLTNKNDRIMFNIQLTHNMIFGANSYFKMHGHWKQVDATQYTMEGEYRILNNGEVPGSWISFSANTVDDAIFTYPGSGDFNQIIDFPGFDITSCDVSSIIQIRLTRTDGNAGDMLVSFMDAHVGIDADGSLVPWSKD